MQKINFISLLVVMQMYLQNQSDKVSEPTSVMVPTNEEKQKDTAGDYEGDTTKTGGATFQQYKVQLLGNKDVW